jgi:hypothetical protein
MLSGQISDRQKLLPWKLRLSPRMNHTSRGSPRRKWKTFWTTCWLEWLLPYLVLLSHCVPPRPGLHRHTHHARAYACSWYCLVYTLYHVTRQLPFREEGAARIRPNKAIRRSSSSYGPGYITAPIMLPSARCNHPRILEPCDGH